MIKFLSFRTKIENLAIDFFEKIYLLQFVGYPNNLIFQAEIQELRDQLALMSQTIDEHRREVPGYTGSESIKVNYLLL